MKDNETKVDQDAAPRPHSGTQLDMLKRVIFFLVLGCFLTSAGLNVFLAYEATTCAADAARYKERVSGCGRVYQFSVRLVSELGGISQRDPEVRDLMAKYRITMRDLGLTRHDVGGPGRVDPSE